MATAMAPVVHPAMSWIEMPVSGGGDNQRREAMVHIHKLYINYARTD